MTGYDYNYNARLIENDANTAYQLNKIHNCAQCYLSSMAFVMTLFGIFIFSVGFYTYEHNVINITYETELLLLIIGGLQIFLSILLWMTTCHYTNYFAKLILLIFSILSFSIFLIMSGLITYWLIYFESNGTINNTEVDKLMNETLYDTYELCCEENFTNSTPSQVLNNVCYDILGHNNTLLTQECSSFNKFEIDFYSFINIMFTYLLIFGSIILVVTLSTGISSCKLVWLYNKVYYYNPDEVSV
jgi:hypothetical protein